MRLLCDQNVDRRYLDAFADTADITLLRVREELDPRASDADIAAYAASVGAVVLTSDDDFLARDAPCGVIYYK